MGIEVRTFEDLENLSRAAADALGRCLREAGRPERDLHIALSGGSTPRPLFSLLARGVGGPFPWERVHLWWGDERLVPPDHEASNHRMARELLLDRVEIPSAQVHRIRGEARDPEAEAERYRRLLQEHLGEAGPAFDVALQGIGEDGHTASLFPGTEALEEQTRWVLPVQAPEGAAVSGRITLTLPLLERSRRVWSLAAGSNKRKAVRCLLDHPGGDPACPASMLAGREETVLWADRAALPGPCVPCALGSTS
ncbi:MAG: 6-phosphogluconolactonase [bacterium]